MDSGLFTLFLPLILAFMMIGLGPLYPFFTSYTCFYDDWFRA